MTTKIQPENYAVTVRKARELADKIIAFLDDNALLHEDDAAAIEIYKAARAISKI